MTSKWTKRRRQDRMERERLKTVDSKAAKAEINRQGRLARAHLGDLLAQHGASEVHDLTARIAPWLGNAWKRGQPEDYNHRYSDPRYFRSGVAPGVTEGHIFPELRRVLEDALGWVEKLRAELGKWSCRNMDKNHSPLCTQPDIMGSIVGEIGSGFHEISWRSKYLVQRPNLYGRDELEKEVQKIHEEFRHLVKRLPRGGPPAPGVEVLHPPQYERLRDGVLERLFSSDLDTQAKDGYSLRLSLQKHTVGLQKVRAWNEATAAVLAKGLSNETKQRFIRQTRGGRICKIPGIDPVALSSAYLGLGLAYLKEVRERMSDYAEAAGQRPQVSISGGTFHGSQIAANIANIQSTIASVQQDEPKVARALTELAKAVHAQKGLDDGLRQELLDNVEYLAEAAQTSPERRKRGLIKSALAGLRSAAVRYAELGNAINPWVSSIDKFLS